MFHDAAFDVEGTNAVAGGCDDVVVTADEIVMPIFVLLHRVAGEIPLAAERGRLGAPIAVEAQQRRGSPFDGKDAGRVRRYRAQWLAGTAGDAKLARDRG